MTSYRRNGNSCRVARPRLTGEERRARELEALARASRPRPRSDNDMVAMLAFTGRGIPDDQVWTFGPAQNVYTFAAWRALGRTVRKGEHGVRLSVWVPMGEATTDPLTGETKEPKCRPASAYVFHVSQTEPLNGKAQVTT